MTAAASPTPLERLSRPGAGVLSAIVMACALAPPVRSAPAQNDQSDIVVAAPTQVARSVWLISGALRPKREPDGNTVVFEGPTGLVVVDTGRHLAHRMAIRAFAESRRLPIVAIVNSHWHLDHVSGNPGLKAAYPGAKVYASRAIDGALAGFLAKSGDDSRAYLKSKNIPPETRRDILGDLATAANGAALRPDVPLDASRVLTLAGRTMALNLAPDAATAGDVWVYDRASRVAAVGDLVTMPSPFLDTACPEGWRAALLEIWKTPFKIAIPGHGSPMSRDQFAIWRAAFIALIDCSGSKRTKAECAADWTGATASLRGPDPRDRDVSRKMTEYYVADVLHANGGKSAYCRAT